MAYLLLFAGVAVGRLELDDGEPAAGFLEPFPGYEAIREVFQLAGDMLWLGHFFRFGAPAPRVQAILERAASAFSKLVSILTGLVRRVSEAARGAATDTNRIQERTMRFMVMGMATTESEAGAPPTPEAIAAMQKYNEELVTAGVLLAAEGLTPTSQGARVKFSGDERTVIDGPFTETKELVAGFSIIQVKSLEEAIELVKRTPNIFPNGEAEVEIRKLMDVEDFGDGFTPNEEIAKVKYK